MANEVQKNKDDNKVQGIFTVCAKSSNNDTSVIKFNVQISSHYGVESCDIIVCCVYTENETISTIMDTVDSFIKTKYDGLQLKIVQISGFTDYVYNPAQNCTSITNYNKKDITDKGLKVEIKPHYHHHIEQIQINCPEMKKLNTSDALQCKIYRNMMQNSQFNKQNLRHLKRYHHFSDEMASKQECKHNQNCDAYKRLESGGNDINDNCHMKLYRHPPRNTQQQLQNNIHSLIISKSQQQNQDLYEPTAEDEVKYKYNEADGYLQALIEEVEANGFKSDLNCDGSNDYSILTVVDEKMNGLHHKSINSPLNRAQMLSLILYTGCACNYDMCKSQRNGDYLKWKWFDYCLYRSIYRLSSCESGSFSVYSGLNAVQLAENKVNCGYFVTYVSTSWKRQIAKAFMGGKGMLIQIDKEFKNALDVQCCDVSWLSKFPDECEILFARSNGWNFNEFKCVVLDKAKDIQTVSLCKK